MRRRGSIIILALMLTLIFLVLGMALVSKRANQYRGGVQAARSASALALAEAGLEDARVKLSKDPDFPPRSAEDQLVFAYAETVLDLDGVTPVGSYEVILDRRWEGPPWRVLRITSIGTLGPVDAPLARRRLTAELDVAEDERSGAGPNPSYFKILFREDEGSL